MKKIFFAVVLVSFGVVVEASDVVPCAASSSGDGIREVFQEVLSCAQNIWVRVFTDDFFSLSKDERQSIYERAAESTQSFLQNPPSKRTSSCSRERLSAEKKARKQVKALLSPCLWYAEGIDEEVIVCAVRMFVTGVCPGAVDFWTRISGIDEAVAMIGCEERKVRSGFWRDVSPAAAARALITIRRGPYLPDNRMDGISQLLEKEAAAQGVELDWSSAALLETLVESLQKKYPYRVAK